MPAQAGIHATIVVLWESCVGPRLHAGGMSPT
jgi:hypothetical protein